mmetsp:Transcript_33543/g.24596  ORF Transcript_33543/g.24596 Transcript_33543/m.24596 type:complete len:80 (+) Transcript_33543:3-242(+)
MRLKELRDLITSEEEEYWEEWKAMKKEEMINDFYQFIYSKQIEGMEVANEIMDLERKDDKDNEIFYNFKKKLDQAAEAK